MGCILAVDFGEKRIGFAISDPDRIISMPLRMIEVKSFNGAVQAVLDVCAEKKPDKVVVGMPLNMDGTSGVQAEKVERFIERIRTSSHVPVDAWDERLSTAQVERMLIETDVSRARRRQVVDKLSAQVVLQSYLDAASQCSI